MLSGRTARCRMDTAARAAASLVRQSGTRRERLPGPTDIFLCIADHWEPQVGRPSRTVARERVDDWLRRYPRIAAAHRDADGRPPVHTFFYPWDEYDEWECSRVAELCAAGWGELELHLHHHDDTEASLRRKLLEAIRTYRGHGALTTWPDGRRAFGFVHGNWALDNSRHERGSNFCGVNSELTVLGEVGCYADFTFPAWGHPSQPRQVNSLFYAVDDPDQPKSHDTGAPVRTGGPGSPGLLIVQGPLVPHLSRGGRQLRFQMDDPDLSVARPYRPERMDRWVRAGIHVLGRPDRIFIKLHCHGCADSHGGDSGSSRHALLGGELEALFRDAEARYNDGRRYRLHYVSAREMFNLVKATEAAAAIDIDAARDWLLPPPGGAVPAEPERPAVRAVAATRA